MPKPKHQPTDAQRKMVKAMSAYGIPQEDIAKVVGVHGETLRTHYRDELDRANAEACAKVAENLFRKATGDGRESVTAAIFWLKTRARWRETLDLSNEDGSLRREPIVQHVTAYLSRKHDAKADPKTG